MKEHSVEINGVKKEFSSLKVMGAYTLLLQAMSYIFQYTGRGEKIPKDLLEKVNRHSRTLLDEQGEKERKKS